MIIGGFAAAVRILLEKDRQDTIFWKIRKFQKNTRKLYFAESPVFSQGWPHWIYIHDRIAKLRSRENCIWYWNSVAQYLSGSPSFFSCVFLLQVGLSACAAMVGCPIILESDFSISSIKMDSMLSEKFIIKPFFE
jgi:hypothetical protein